MMNNTPRIIAYMLIFFSVLGVAWAGEPVNVDLSREAQSVLTYLEAIYGKKVVSGISGNENAEKIKRLIGKYPAILALDISGWNSPTWGSSYTRVVEGFVERAKAWWENGGIVTMQFHWKHPGKPNGTAWVNKHGKHQPSGPFDLARATTPGTKEHRQVMRDLEKTGNYLEQLREAGVPVLWRPLHEIDGGWFWWTDKTTPENTAKLWRMMFDYYVKQRKLNNLIWVYGAAFKTSRRGRDVEQIKLRKRYYPGAKYVHISSIAIYANAYYGWKPYSEDSYMKAYRIMQEVSPGKMLALSESGAIPNLEMMQAEGPRWLYTLSWWAGGKQNPPAWIKKTYSHPLLVTRDELPNFKK